MKKTIVPTLIGMMVLCLLGACSKAGDKNEDKDTSSDQHTYEISIAGGKTYKGGVPRYAPGVVTQFNPVAFVNEQSNGKAIAVMLAEVGAFQIGLGFLLDDNNKPIHTEVQGFAFGEWGIEDKYGPVGPVSMTLEDYKEHNYSFAGEEGTVASFTLNFSGKFRLGADGEEVDVTGEIVVAAP
ncbi:hypothetical protein ACFOET_04580 [Parapedobacter deserti]|uniref:Uncharacterized protein n=1 Tax=Parapedobacter deserti TaxID=1912957 RepID=A0ABV7JFY8_9SPHI